MKKFLLVAAALISLSACNEVPQNQVETENVSMTDDGTVITTAE